MKISIGVFFGGRSVEHEVSIISALQAVRAFDRTKYDITPVYISREGRFYIGEAVGKIEEYSNIPALIRKSTEVLPAAGGGRLKLLRQPAKRFGNPVMAYIDVAFPVVHGTNVEDGALQGYFRTLGVPFAGCDVFASAAGMDKFAMKALFRERGLPVLPCLRFTGRELGDAPGAAADKVISELGLPVVVKPVNLGSSVGIRLAHSREELLDALDYASSFASAVLAEKAVQNLREINCSVLGDRHSARASVCEEPLNATDILSYEDKYIGNASKSGSKGMASTQRRIPADIPKETEDEIRTMAVKAFRVLGCSGVSRIDFMIDASTGKVWLNEINTIPGSLSFYLWEPLGVSYTELIDEMISLAMKRERERESITYSFDTNVLSGIKLGGKKTGKM